MSKAVEELHNIAERVRESNKGTAVERLHAQAEIARSGGIQSSKKTKVRTDDAYQKQLAFNIEQGFKSQFPTEQQYKAYTWQQKWNGKGLSDVQQALLDTGTAQDEKDWLSTWYRTDRGFLDTLSSDEINSIRGGGADYADLTNKYRTAQKAYLDAKTGGKAQEELDALQMDAVSAYNAMTAAKDAKNHSGLEDKRARMNQLQQELTTAIELEGGAYGSSGDPAAIQAELDKLKEEVSREEQIAESLDWAYNRAKNREAEKAFDFHRDSADYAANSRAGSLIVNPTFEEAASGYDGNMVFGNEVQWYLQNKDSFEKLLESGQRKMIGSNAEVLYEKGKYQNWDQMDRNQIEMHDYLLETYGQEAAQDYLKAIAPKLNELAFTQRGEELKQEYNEAGTGGKIVMNLQTIPAQFAGNIGAAVSDLSSAATGRFDPYSQGHQGQQYANVVRESTSEDILNQVGEEHPVWGQFLANSYQSVMSGLDSALGATLLGNGYTVLMGAGAASERAKELYDAGASGKQIAAGAAASGVLEWLTEKYSIERFTDKFLSGDRKTLAEWAKNTFIQGFNEASEETASEIGNMILDALINGANSDNSREIRELMNNGLTREEAERQAVRNRAMDIFWAAYGGFVSGGAMGGAAGAVSGGVNAVNDYNIGTQILASGNAAELTRQAQSLTDERQKAKLTKAAQSVQNENQWIDGRRYKAGKVSGQIARQAAMEFRNANTDTFRDAARDYINGNDKIMNKQKALDTVMKKYSDKAFLPGENAYFKMIGGQKLMDAIMDSIGGKDGLSKAAEDRRAKSMRTVLDVDSTQRGVEVSRLMDDPDFTSEDNGVPILKGSKESVSVEGISRNENGKLYLNTDNGEVDAADISYGSRGQAKLFSVIANSHMDTGLAQDIFADFNSSKLDSATYAKAVLNAFIHGRNNTDFGSISGSSYAAMLDEELRRRIYDVGRKSRSDMVSNRQRKLDHGKHPRARSGLLHWDKSTVNMKLNDRQQSAMDIANALAGIGMTVGVYASTEETRKQNIPNGKFYKDGTIWIDLNAGVDGSGLAAFALAHEFTHFVEEFSPAEFQKFADILFKESGVDANKLLERKRNELAGDPANSKLNEQQMNDLAYSEMIAEAMETVFTDTDAIARISDQIRQQDKTLWEKIADFLKGLVEKLRKAYKGVDPDSRTAQEMRPILSTSEKILDAYVNAAVSAIEQYSTLSPTNEATAFDADMKSKFTLLEQTSVKHSERVRADAIIKQLTDHMSEIMAMNAVATINKANAAKFTPGDRQANTSEGVSVFQSQGGEAYREGFGKVLLSNSSAAETVFHGNGPAKQATFPAIKAVIEQGIHVYTDQKHNDLNFDTYTFAAPIKFFDRTVAMAAVVRSYFDGKGDKVFYVHEICDSEGNFVMLSDDNIVTIKQKNKAASNGGDSVPRLDAAGGRSSNNSLPPEPYGVNKNSMKSSRYSDYSKMSYAEIENEQRILAQQEMSLRDRKRNAETNSELVDAMNAYSDLFSEMRKLLPKKRNGTATQSDLDRIDEIKSIRDEYMNKIADIQERIGLNAIYEEEAALREKKEELRKAADAAWEREGAEKENKAIEKSGLSPEEYFRGKALKAFKTTSNFNEAGYLLPDGKMLNFSGGERNHRYRDHREIGEIYEATNGVAALNRFLNDGNIRIMAESPGIDISSSVEPTGKQYEVIRKFVNSHGLKEQQFFVDFSGADGGRAGNYAYEGRVSAERVINDIKYYYENGTTREQSYLSAFYSSRNADKIQKQAEETLPEEFSVSDVLKSSRVTDQETLRFLDDQDYITTYRSMQLIDGKLYPPMAAIVNGNTEDYSELGTWEEAVEHPELIKIVNGKPKFTLNKGKGQGSIDAAYNPYMHSSNLVINDQFSGAYTRPNLVVVECHVPVSELSSGYRAQYAKDTTGWHSWHTGTVAGALRKAKGIERQVVLSRWIKPVRILSNQEVAAQYKELLSGTDISVPDNVVSPGLLAALREAGVNITESGRIKNSAAQKNNTPDGVKYSLRTFEDGRRFVDVNMEPSAFDGMDVSQMNKKAKEIIRSKFMSKVIGIDNPVFVNGDSVNEYIHPSKNIDINIRTAKLTAGTELDNLIDAGTQLPDADDGQDGHVHDNVKYFSYYETVFKIGNEYFSGKVNVMNIRNGRLLKDITKKRNITQDIVSSYGLNPKSNFLRDISMNSISPKASDVNPDSMKSSRNRMSEETKAAIDAYRAQQDALSKAQKALYNQERKEIVRAYQDKLKNLERSYSQEVADIQKAFFSLVRSYEAKADEAGASGEMVAELTEALKQEVKAHDIDRELWEQEFSRLTREYEKLKGTSADKVKALEEKVQHQREAAHAKVESARKTEMRHKIQNAVNTLNRYLLNPTKDIHVPDSMQASVTLAMQAINGAVMSSKSAANEARLAGYYKQMSELQITPTSDAARIMAKRQELQGKIDRLTSQNANMKQALGKLRDAYQSLSEMGDPIYDDVVDQLLEDCYDRVGDTQYKDMSLEQLENIHDAYTAILSRIRKQNKAFREGATMRIDEMVQKYRREMNDRNKRDKLTTKGKEAASQFWWNNTKPVYAFDRIGSSVLSDLYNGLRKGEDTWYRDVEAARVFYLGTAARYNYDSWDFGKMYDFESATGEKFRLNLEEVMSLYAYSLRDQARDHLLKGGIVLNENTERTVVDKLGVKRNMVYNDANAYALTDETISEIHNVLTADQRAFAREMQRYLSEVMGEKGNEVSLKLYDIRMFREKNYWPLKSSSKFSERAKESQENPANKIKNSGFTKATVKNASNPVELSGFMETWAEHINGMSMYHAFTLPMEDFYRVYNWRGGYMQDQQSESTQSILEQVCGAGAVKYIDQFLRDLNGGLRADPRESFGKAMMSKFKKGAVYASASVAIQQPSAIGRAFSVISPAYFAGGKVEAADKTWEQLKKYAPVAGLKEMGRFDMDMGKSTEDYIMSNNRKLGEKVDAVLGWAPEMADRVTWCAIWEAAKRQTASRNPSLKGEALLQKAGDLFTECITRTQVYDSVFSRSANMRSKSGMMNMVTAFMAEPTTTINMMDQAIRQFARGNKRAAARTAASVVTSVILNAMLVSFVYAARDKDEDKTYWEKYAAHFASGMYSGLNPLTYTPYVKDIWSLAQGYDIERADMALYSDAMSSVNRWINVASNYSEDMTDEEQAKWEKSLFEAGWSSVDSVAAFFGIPVKNIRRDVNAALNMLKKSNWEDMSGNTVYMAVMDSLQDDTPIWNKVPRDKDADILYRAMISGDAVFARRRKAKYATAQKLDSAINSGLRQNDPRIKEAAQASIDGDNAHKIALSREILAEGNFTQNQIAKAINDEISRLEDLQKEKKDWVETEQYFYTASDYIYAVINNIGSADAMMREQVRARTENGIRKYGKTKEQAEEAAEEGFKYAIIDEVREQYTSGRITDDQAVRVLKKAKAYSDEEYCEEIVRVWEIKNQIGTRYGWTNKRYIQWEDLISPAGITMKQWESFIDGSKELRGEDKDGDGNTDAYSVMNAWFNYIDALPLSSAQKDALLATNQNYGPGTRSWAKRPWAK